MDVADNSTQDVSTQTEGAIETPAVEQTPAVETQGSDSIESFIESKQATKGTETQAVPTYTPNYKYKVKDQEREFPDFIRSAIKDENTEKSIRDILSKADGLDEVKASRDELQKRYQSVEPEYKQLKNNYSELVHHWQSAGVDTNTGKIQNVPALEAAFSKLGISDKVLFNYVNEKLNQIEKPDSSYTYAQRLQAENYRLQQEREQYQQQLQTHQLSTVESQINSAMSTPDVQVAISHFGGEQAFRDEIIMRGRVYQSQGVIKPPQEIAAEIARPFQALASQNTPQAPSPQAPAAQAAKPAVIPVLKGGGSSVVKQKVTSIADIEKRFEQLSNGN